MEFNDTDLIAEFATESQEGLANIEQQMLAIEAGGSDVDLDLVNAVFRTMHTIKGTAGFLGLDRIGTLAHRLEEVLDDMRNRQIVPSSELVTTVLKAADYMKDLIDAVDTSNDADISVYVENLEKFRPGTTTADCQADAVQAAVETRTATPANPAPQALGEAVREFLIECYENLDRMDRDLLAHRTRAGVDESAARGFSHHAYHQGGRGFLGLSGLESLAHAAENLLGKLRDGTLPLNSDVASALLATVDKCREGLLLLETRGSDAGFEFKATLQQLLAAENSRSPRQRRTRRPYRSLRRRRFRTLRPSRRIPNRPSRRPKRRAMLKSTRPHSPRRTRQPPREPWWKRARSRPARARFGLTSDCSTN